jgi:hypothetical protein
MGDVDVVESDTGATDHDQVGSGVEDLGGHLGCRPDHEGGGSGYGGHQLRSGQPQLDIDLVAGVAERIEGDLRESFGDEYTGHPPIIDVPAPC